MVSININEKTNFEKLIIEAFKSENPKELYEKLSEAWKDLEYNKENLNKNIVDKLSRIIERKYININILIGKLFEKLIYSQEQIDFLSDDIDLLIKISNCILNLLDNIKSTIVSKSLETKCTLILNYLNKIDLSAEQKIILKELLNSYPTRNNSNIYKNFSDLSIQILRYISSNSFEDIFNGVSLLIESFANTNNLDEQFELIKYLPDIIDLMIKKENKKDVKEIYYQLCNFFCSFLYGTQYEIEANTNGYLIDSETLNNNKLFLIIDSFLVNEYTKNQFSFLHKTGYELTYQKQLLLSSNNICEMTVKIVEILLFFEDFFDMQYIAYLLLKRVFFNFPKFIIFIEDDLVKVLFNLCHFKDKNNDENNEEGKAFLKFLIKNKLVPDSLRNKVIKLIKSYKIILSKDLDISNIDKEPLILNNFNLRVGSPYSMEIQPAVTESQFLEVYYPNSIIYIAFAVECKDISFEILKFNDNDSFNSVENYNFEEEKDNLKFISVVKVDYIQSSSIPVKFILFVRKPGLYKIVWDNTYSWFTKKKIRYRVSVLKPIEDNNQLKEKPSQVINNPVKNEKILNINYEGKAYALEISPILNKIKAIKINCAFYLSIPVFVTRDFIRIYDSFTNKFNEYSTSSNNFDETLSFESFTEQIIINHIEKMGNTDHQVIFINIFLLDRYLNQLKFFSKTRHLLKKNYNIYIASLVDSCLIYYLFNAILNDSTLRNTLYIHLDTIKPQISMFYEGVINNKINELKYKDSNLLEQNVITIIDFISHLVALFGNFDIVISFTEYEKTDTRKFLSILIDKSEEKYKEKMKFFIQNKEFLMEVINCSHLFKINNLID